MQKIQESLAIVPAKIKVKRKDPVKVRDALNKRWTRVYPRNDPSQVGPDIAEVVMGACADRAIPDVE